MPDGMSHAIQHGTPCCRTGHTMGYTEGCTMEYTVRCPTHQGFSRCTAELRCGFFNSRILQCGAVRRVLRAVRCSAVQCGADFDFLIFIRCGAVKPGENPHRTVYSHSSKLPALMRQGQRCGAARFLFLESYGAVPCGAVRIFFVVALRYGAVRFC